MRASDLRFLCVDNGVFWAHENRALCVFEPQFEFSTQPNGKLEVTAIVAGSGPSRSLHPTSVTQIQPSSTRYLSRCYFGEGRGRRAVSSRKGSTRITSSPPAVRTASAPCTSRRGQSTCCASLLPPKQEWDAPPCRNQCKRGHSSFSVVGPKRDVNTLSHSHHLLAQTTDMCGYVTTGVEHSRVHKHVAWQIRKAW